jgi:hypothetical protein
MSRPASFPVTIIASILALIFLSFGCGVGVAIWISRQGDNNFAGAAWVFTRSSGTWSQQGNKLVGNDAFGNATQGVSVALSADGNTAIVGGPADNNGAGAAWVFTRNGTVWTQQGNNLSLASLTKCFGKIPMFFGRRHTSPPAHETTELVDPFPRESPA